ncbi:MAG: CsgG/HfaB family protein [Synergistaceae bacterium]|jgi:curli biogenesis system outer membrane secretion channel CsgG|nr:CsgG/HfaB family protein [Synergistaceae bacterium]
MKLSLRIFFMAFLTFSAFALCVAATESDAAEKIRVGVMKFDSKAMSFDGKTNNVDDRQAGIITDMFTQILASGSKSITVRERSEIERIGEEIILGIGSHPECPDRITNIGRILGLQYMLYGSVTDLRESSSMAAVSILATVKRETLATIEVRVIDVAAGEVILTLAETGAASNSSSTLSSGDIVLSKEEELGDIKVRAARDASVRLAHRIRAELCGEYAYVLSESDGEFTIDQGEASGAENGAPYLVYVDGPELLGVNGNAIGRKKIPLALLKVTRTESNHSVCKVAPPSNGELIRRGDKVEPIFSEEAKRMGHWHWPKARPKIEGSDDTYNRLFGDENDTPK